MPPRRSSGRGRALSRDRIVQCALHIVDEEGLEALTMRRLGAALGVEAMSLYGHVQNKEALLDLVQEAVLAELEEVPAEGDWRTRLRHAAHAYRNVLGRHPNALPLFATRWVRTPQAIAVVEVVLEVLRKAGLSELDCAYAFDAFTAYVVGQAFSQWGDRRRLTPEQFVEEHVGALSQLPPERFPTVAAVLPGLQHFDFEANFTFGLECLLDGLAARLRPCERS